MTAVVWAALAALTWGVGDYCGGKASRLSPAASVTVVSQLLSIPVLGVCLVLLPGRPIPVDIAWGLAAGVAGLFGIVLLYLALSRGSMTVVAPITAVTGALVPLVAGLIFEEVPGVLALSGAVCAVAAIALVSLGPRSGVEGGAGRLSVSGRLLGLALGAGATFGVFFALLGQVSSEAGMWSLIAVRAGSIPVGLIVLFATGGSLRLPRPAWPWVVVAGPLDVIANAAYIVATYEGQLSVVAPIAALYPASTVLLALAVDRERLRPDRKSTRLNSSHWITSRMPSSA